MGLSIFVILASSQSPPQFFLKSGSVAAQIGILASSQSSWDDAAKIIMGSIVFNETVSSAFEERVDFNILRAVRPRQASEHHPTSVSHVGSNRGQKLIIPRSSQTKVPLSKKKRTCQSSLFEAVAPPAKWDDLGNDPIIQHQSG